MSARRAAPRVVAVTGMNATDNPAPGVGVLRSLREGAQPGAAVAGARDRVKDCGKVK